MNVDRVKLDEVVAEAERYIDNDEVDVRDVAYHFLMENPGADVKDAAQQVAMRIGYP